MCTVSFLPFPSGGYLLATNRDESHRRSEALPPRVVTYGSTVALAPTDRDAGGTWVATSGDGVTLCLLNADRTPRVPPPSDAPSRGLLVTSLMERPADVEQRLHERWAGGRMREKGFKLLVARPGGGGATARLSRLDWDGVELVVREVPGASVTVSSTHATEAVTRYRQEAFEALRRAAAGDAAGDAEVARQRQWDWHASHAPDAPEGDAFSVCMHREDARTVSCTAVYVGDDLVSMDYEAGHPCRAGERSRVCLDRASVRAG